MPDCATTLLALKEVDLPNLGVTLDFAHVLYADEQPAYSAALVAKPAFSACTSMTATPSATTASWSERCIRSRPSSFSKSNRIGYDGPIYFDTFPDTTGLDPVGECEANIATVKRC